MAHDNRDSQAGISFRDVADLLRQVGREHGGIAGFTLDLPVRSDNGVALAVRCLIKRRDGKSGAWNDVGGVSGRWPSGGSSTFAGLLFRLAYELSAKLDEERTAAERAARDQPRLI